MTYTTASLRPHDGITVPDSPSLRTESVTVECWIWPESGALKSKASIVSKTNTDRDAGWGLVCDSEGFLTWFVFAGGRDTPQRLSFRVPNLAWSHVAATYDGCCARVFVNGAVAAETASETKPAPVDHVACDLRIGVSLSGKHRIGFHGLISDVRVWSRARSPGQIVSHMRGLTQAPRAAARQGLVLLLAMEPLAEQGEGTAVVDWSGSGNNGSLVRHAKLVRVSQPKAQFAPAFSLRALCIAALSALGQAAPSSGTLSSSGSSTSLQTSISSLSLDGNSAAAPEALPASPSLPSLRDAAAVPFSITAAAVARSGCLKDAPPVTMTTPPPKRVPGGEGREEKALPASQNAQTAQSRHVRRTSSVPLFTDAPKLSIAALAQQKPPSPPQTIPIHGVTVFPATLRFGADGGQAALDTAYTQKLNVSNGSIQKISLQLHPVVTPRYTLRFEPQSSAIKPGGSADITASITLHCTTAVRETVQLSATTEQKKSGLFRKKSKDEASSSEDSQFFVPLPLDISSVISTSLDPSELELDPSQPPIGEGAYTVVHRGKWRTIPVAVKKLKSAFVESHGADVEFSRETQLLSAIRCPYIVTFLGSVRQPGNWLLVLEFLPLGSLGTLLKRHTITGPGAMKLKVKIAENTAHGCAFLHSSGLIHRDIKPDNILICSMDPSTPIVAKLTDFGTSRSEAQTAAMTGGVGTPIYMPPEILEQQPYTKSADVYSFAITLFESFIEASPFPQKQFQNPWDITNFITSGKRPAFPKEMHPKYARIIEACWHQNPARRPTFIQVLDAVEDLLKEFP